MYPNTRSSMASAATLDPINLFFLPAYRGTLMAPGALTRKDLIDYVRVHLGDRAVGVVLKELITDNPTYVYDAVRDLETEFEALGWAAPYSPDRYTADLAYPIGYTGDLQEGAFWSTMRAVQAARGQF